MTYIFSCSYLAKCRCDIDVSGVLVWLKFAISCGTVSTFFSTPEPSGLQGELIVNQVSLQYTHALAPIRLRLSSTIFIDLQ